MDIAFSPVVTMRASEAIYNQIKNKILSGELQPGDRLPSERAMIEMFDRSRPTIREAMRMLERDGFIKISSGSNGAVIQKYGISNIEQPLETIMAISDVSEMDLYEFRQKCECNIASWAAQRRSEADIRAMKILLQKADAYLKQYDIENFMITDTQFHLLLANASGNKVAAIITNICHNITAKMLNKAYNEKTEESKRRMCATMLRSHRQIYAAVCKGDAQGAAEEMHKHLEYFRSAFHT